MCEFLKIPLNTKIKKNDKILNIYKELDLTELNASYPVLYDNFAKFILENTGIKIHQNNTMNAENQEKIELKLYKKEIEISKIERFIIKYKFLSKFL